MESTDRGQDFVSWWEGPNGREKIWKALNDLPVNAQDNPEHETLDRFIEWVVGEAWKGARPNK